MCHNTRCRKRWVVQVAQTYQSIDISQSPELLRVAEEVRDTNRPRALTRNHTIVALVVPPRAQRKSVATSPESDYEAFLASAGGWKDLVDTEQLKKNIKDARGSDRPDVRL